MPRNEFTDTGGNLPVGPPLPTPPPPAPLPPPEPFQGMGFPAQGYYDDQPGGGSGWSFDPNGNYGPPLLPPSGGAAQPQPSGGQQTIVVRREGGYTNQQIPQGAYGPGQQQQQQQQQQQANPQRAFTGFAQHGGYNPRRGF
ncbi:MAG: hypothetical protein KKI08_23730 [Armatimonadetes bacterium]|nr:hypothetical protein [Armatimonadota bacterium]